MKRRMLLALVVPMLFLGFTGCGGGGEDPKPEMPASAKGLTPKEQKELEAQLASLQVKFGAAKAACQQSFGPAVAVAIQQQQTSLPPVNQDACFAAVQNFLLEYKTAWNGQYAQSAEGQAFIFQSGPALLNAVGGGQQVSPATAASLAFPAYNDFMNSLDPSLRGQVAAATNPYLNNTGGVTVTGTTTTTTTTGGFPSAPATGSGNLPPIPVLPVGFNNTTDTVPGMGDFTLVY